LKIRFISKLVDFEIKNQKSYINWIDNVVGNEKYEIDEVNIYFVSEEEILKINKDFLNHNYVTDIITFDSTFLRTIAGELFICVSEIRRNTEIHTNYDFCREFNRVIIHGILHLIGYNDFTNAEKKIMREKENFYLKLFI
jgi:probable rRNA maturation factor